MLTTWRASHKKIDTGYRDRCLEGIAGTLRFSVQFCCICLSRFSHLLPGHMKCVHLPLFTNFIRSQRELVT